MMNLELRLLVLLLCLAGAAVQADDDRDEDGTVLERVRGLLGQAASVEDDETEEALSRAGEYIDGRAAVRLGTARMEQAGIVPQTLAVVSQRTALAVRAEVLDTTPLLGARGSYRQARSRLLAARERHATSRDVLRDLRGLSGRSLPPRQRLREAELEAGLAAAELAGAEAAVADARLAMTARWGGAVAERVLGMDDDAAFANWLQEQALVLVTLPPGTRLESGDRLQLGAVEAERPARVLGPAGPVGIAQGETWMALTEAEGLRAGMQLAAGLQSAAVRTGVVVPESAVVWHYGRPWFYLRHEAGLFLRTPLVEAERVPQGWFLPDPALAGHAVVATGAQALLSEESRWNIPEEDDAD